jgi:hypothetical protein
MQQFWPAARSPSMPSLLLSALLLQVPLAKPIKETLTTLWEAPIIARVITVCVIIAIVLGFLEKQFKLLDSLIGTLQSIQAKLRGEGAVTTLSNRGHSRTLLGCSNLLLQRFSVSGADGE